MGDVAQQVAVLHAEPPEFVEMADMAYHIAAQCAPDAQEEALDLADMLQVSRAHFRAARQEIADHREGRCPPYGHHGRPCSQYVADYDESHGGREGLEGVG